MTLNERLGGKGYKPRKDSAGRRVSGDWENSDRGGGHKSKKRAGGKVEKKSPTYLAYVKNKNKALNNSYEPEGEFLSYEEVEVFVESLVEQGYTEEQILLELDKKGFGSVVLGKGLELGMGAIKNTFKAGRATRGFVNRAVKDTKLTKDIWNAAKTIRQPSTSSKGGTLKNFMGRVRGKLNRTDIKTNTPMKTVKPEVLGGAATKNSGKTLKNVTPKRLQVGNAIKNATDKVKVGASAGAGVAIGSAATNKKVATVSSNSKKEVNPTKNPVVKKTSERGRTVDRVYGAQIAQTRKLKGDVAAAKQRQKFINRPITSREMDESVKDELLANARKAHKKAKNFKKWRNEADKARQTTLKKGEVRWMDKKTGKWKTNKPG